MRQTCLIASTQFYIIMKKKRFAYDIHIHSCLVEIKLKWSREMGAMQILVVARSTKHARWGVWVCKRIKQTPIRPCSFLWKQSHHGFNSHMDLVDSNDL
jgi:hypothetical protein